MADRFIPEHRRTNYKAKGTFKPDELRRRREEAAVEIRKAKREENLAKRRGIGTGDNRPGASLGAAPDSDDETAPTESQVRFISNPISFFQASIFFCPLYLGFLPWRRVLHNIRARTRSLLSLLHLPHLLKPEANNPFE